jgi:hypothetical protein
MKRLIAWIVKDTGFSLYQRIFYRLLWNFCYRTYLDLENKRPAGGW